MFHAKLPIFGVVYPWLPTFAPGGIPTTVKSAMGNGYDMLWFSFGITYTHLTHRHVSSVVCIQSNQSTSKSKTDSSQPFSYKEIGHILMGFCFLTGEFAQDHVVQRFRVMAMKHALQSGSACWSWRKGVARCVHCPHSHPSLVPFTPSPAYLMRLHMFYVVVPCALFFFHPKILNEIPITIFRLQVCFHLFQPFETYYCMWSYQL